MPERIDLAALVRGIAEHLRPAAERDGCALSFEATAPVPVLADPAQMGHVITNLVTNAIKFGAGGRISIVVASSGAHAILSVKDEGIGIALADQARIFERYTRAVSEMEYGGFGLGLFLSREIVKFHGGTIRVFSVPGHGATFTVELPLAATEPSP